MTIDSSTGIPSPRRAPAAAPIVLDVADALMLLDQARAITTGLHGREIGTPEGLSRARNNNGQAAALARDLLRSADLCRAAASEVSLQYWRFRGFDDPRDNSFFSE